MAYIVLTQHYITSQKTGEATISESHESFAPNTAPSRRGRHRSAAAGRSDKADLGFPLAQREERFYPRTRLQGGSGTRRCHRVTHRQPPSRVFTRAGDRPSAKRRRAVASSQHTIVVGSLSTRRSTLATTIVEPQHTKEGPRWSHHAG
jgi:hypothetical protein